MQQILFHIPFTSWALPPDGVPLSGFGALLFLTFVLIAIVWGPHRTAPVGVSRERLLDLAIVIFLTGIAGARLVYMIQYYERDFPDKSPLGLLTAFFQIWNGGIVFYGSVIGGVLGYIVFYRRVLRKLNVSTWKLADAVAPLIALGLLVGRMGCYLNGCCWGQPACPECQVVPLPPALGQFPLLPAHSRDQVVRPAADNARKAGIHGLQTSTGFSLESGARRTIVAAVEPGSAAQMAGVKAGDRVTSVNGQPNTFVLELTSDSEEALNSTIDACRRMNGTLIGEVEIARSNSQIRVARISFETETDQANGMLVARSRGVSVAPHDVLWESVRDWPQTRKGQKTMVLGIERGSEKFEISFVPRTVVFYPTQVYEMVSMFLLIMLILAYQPFRRHDGQLMVLLMLGYAAHRFLNEAIRIEPTYALGLTLSQWISIGIVAAAVILEVYLRLKLPKRNTSALPEQTTTNVTTPSTTPVPAM